MTTNLTLDRAELLAGDWLTLTELAERRGIPRWARQGLR
jgi:hypothetical protein